MPYDRAMRSPALTVMHGKSTTVLEMEHNVIDFLTLSTTPWDNGAQAIDSTQRSHLLSYNPCLYFSHGAVQM